MWTPLSWHDDTNLCPFQAGFATKGIWHSLEEWEAKEESAIWGDHPKWNEGKCGILMERPSDQLQ